MLRGDVYRLRLPKGSGHEQSGHRYAVVVQSDVLMPSSTVAVVPTSRSARAASFRPEALVADEPARLLVEQLRAIDAQRLGRRVGHLTVEEMWAVDEALELVLGLG